MALSLYISKMPSEENANEFISPEAIQRIARDVKDIMREPLDNCIYIHDSKNIMKGYALILGTDDTPYHCVPMMYVFNFPSDYPYSPPKLSFRSYKNGFDTRPIRLHPNYYTNGKCCLSILNTWRGEPWSGCQTIRSVLTTIQMTLSSFPLEHEPGVSGHLKQGKTFRAMIYCAGLNMIHSFLTKQSMNRISPDDETNETVLVGFREFMKNHLRGPEGKKLLGFLKDKESTLNQELSSYDDTVARSFYNQELRINYSEIRDILCSWLPTFNVEN
mgnify:CR=1 FL=1